MGKKGITAAEVEAGLRRQLEDRGAATPHFLALLADYMYYYKQEKRMQADVRRNGLTVTAISAAGKEYDKENPAIKAAALYNKQKLAILRELDLTTDTVPPADDAGGNL